MSFTAIGKDLGQALSTFRGLKVDDQLALLWFAYTKMGKSITPAAPGAAEPEIAEGLFNQIKEKSQQEQLDVQRCLLAGEDTLISREYGSLSPNTKLLLWYRLAQGMDAGTIIPMPNDYKMSETANQLLSSLEQAEFQEQIAFLREVVTGTGAEPAEGSKI